jgi:hypothetical protein
MNAVLGKKTAFTQASNFKKGHPWYVKALGIFKEFLKNYNSSAIF